MNFYAVAITTKTMRCRNVGLVICIEVRENCGVPQYSGGIAWAPELLCSRGLNEHWHKQKKCRDEKSERNHTIWL